ncbi:MAG: TMEM43 family protein [Chloroflexota bacterium]
MAFNRFRNRQGRSNPFVTALFGIGLFLGSFVLLFINEGRVDISKVARGSIAVSANQEQVNHQGELLAVSGVLHADATISDPELLNTGEFLYLRRDVEMYAWDEERNSDSDNNASSTNRYEYNREWTDNPQDSNQFNRPNGHYNPPMRYQGEVFRVEHAEIGRFSVAPDQLLFMQQRDLPLSSNIILDGRIEEEYLFIGSGSLAQPDIGDLRIQFSTFENDQQVTVFGAQNENRLQPFTGPKDSLLYRVYPGDRDTAIEAMRTEFLTILWGFRAAGIGMMWLGLMTMVSPLTNLIGNVPIVGGLGRFAAAFVFLFVAIVLGSITIVISAILNSIVAMIVIFILLIGGFFYWRSRQE